MKKMIKVIILLLIVNININSITLTLKDEIKTDKNIVTLKDLITSKDLNSIPDINILKLSYLPKELSGKDILKVLFYNNIYDINLIGEKVSILSGKKTILNNEIIRVYNPVSFLENHFQNYFNDLNIKIKINVEKVYPNLHIDNVTENYKWEIKKIDKGLMDIEKMKHLTLWVNNHRYKTELDYKIIADVWFAKDSFLINDYLNKESFYKKHTDISHFKNINSLVLNIDQINNAKLINDINSGEILRWKHIKKIPLLQKGESTNLVYNKENIEVNLYCTTLEEGYENEKIKIQLLNGKEKMGILKNNDGLNYVELY